MSALSPGAERTKGGKWVPVVRERADDVDGQPRVGPSVWRGLTKPNCDDAIADAARAAARIAIIRARRAAELGAGA